MISQTIPSHVGTQPGMHPDDQPETTGEETPPRQKKYANVYGVASPLPLANRPARQHAASGPRSWEEDWEEAEREAAAAIAEMQKQSTDAGYEGFTTRLPTSTRRYDSTPTPAPPRTTIRVTHHGSEVPPRAHAGQQRKQPRQPAPQQTAPARVRAPKPLPGQRTRSRGERVSGWATWIGVGAVAAVVGVGAVLPWWNSVQDEWHYGTPRTVQMDAVVGGDSVAHPTHFIATNIAGRPSVIEMHASDPNRTSEIVLPMTTDPRFPVLLTIKDVNHDRHPDLLVTVNGVQYAYLNDGHGTFRPLKDGEKIDL